MFPRIWEAIGLLAAVGASTLILGDFIGALSAPHSTERFGLIFLAQFLVIAAAVRYGLQRSGSPVRDVLPLRSVPKAFVGGWFLLLFGGFLLAAFLGLLLQRLWPKPETFRVAEKRVILGEGSPVFGFLVIVILGPILEELLFRGVILHGFLRNYSRRKAVVASALLFGVYHVNPWQAVGASVLGLLFGSWRATTGSLLPGIAGHMVLNGIVFWGRLKGPDKPPGVPSPGATATVGVFALGLLVLGTRTLRRRARRAPVSPPVGTDLTGEQADYPPT